MYIIDDSIKPFEKKLWLSSPTMHGDEQKWVDEAIRTNWVSTVGENINEVERQMAEYLGVKYAVGLSCQLLCILPPSWQVKSSMVRLSQMPDHFRDIRFSALM